MLHLTDTHCHLAFDRFNGDRSEVIERAHAAGVTRILVPAVDLQDSHSALQLNVAHPGIYAAVGVHPNSALTWGAGSLQDLRTLASRPGVVAIGEIGLDHYRQSAPHDVQEEVLRQQLALAAELGLPVVLHNRQAEHDLLKILSEWHAHLLVHNPQLAQRPGVLHSFSGDLSTAWRAIEMNFYIGITGPVTYKNAPDLQSIVSSLPLDHLLIETDAPFLAPHPHRGKRNEPAFVRLVAEKIAELLGVSVPEVAAQTTKNSAALFGWGELV